MLPQQKWMWGKFDILVWLNPKLPMLISGSMGRLLKDKHPSRSCKKMKTFHMLRYINHDRSAVACPHIRSVSPFCISIFSFSIDLSLLHPLHVLLPALSFFMYSLWLSLCWITLSCSGFREMLSFKAMCWRPTEDLLTELLACKSS